MNELETINVSFQIKATIDTCTLQDILMQFLVDNLPDEIESYSEYMQPNDGASLKTSYAD